MGKGLKAKSAKFGFEHLEVWQKAADFADKIISVVDKLNTDRRHNRLIEQLEWELIQFNYIAGDSLV